MEDFAKPEHLYEFLMLVLLLVKVTKGLANLDLVMRKIAKHSQIQILFERIEESNHEEFLFHNRDN